MGWRNPGRISRIVVHPTNPDIVYVAALGHAYGPQPERGIYRGMDAGKTWERVLFVNDSTGASGLVMDTNTPRLPRPPKRTGRRRPGGDPRRPCRMRPSTGSRCRKTSATW